MSGTVKLGPPPKEGSGGGGTSDDSTNQSGWDATTQTPDGAGTGSGLVEGETYTLTDGSTITLDRFGDTYFLNLDPIEGSDISLAPPTLGDDPRADNWESLYTGDASDFEGSWAYLDEIKNPYTQQYIVGYEEVGSIDSYVNGDSTGLRTYIEAPIYAPIYAEDTKSRDAFDAALNKAKEQRDKSYKEAFKDYDTVKAEEEAKKKTTNWDLTFRYEDWALPMPQFMPYKAIPTVDVTRMHIEGNMYDWMAGGALYDAQLAGGSLYQGVGDLNSTVFLGLENKNNPSIIDRDRNNLAEVHKILNVTAGEDSSPEASSAFLMHMKRIAESVAYNVAAQEFNTGQINQTTPSFDVDKVDTVHEVLGVIGDGIGFHAVVEAWNDVMCWLFKCK